MIKIMLYAYCPPCPLYKTSTAIIQCTRVVCFLGGSFGGWDLFLRNTCCLVMKEKNGESISVMNKIKEYFVSKNAIEWKPACEWMCMELDNLNRILNIAWLCWKQIQSFTMQDLTADINDGKKHFCLLLLAFFLIRTLDLND